MSNPVQFIPLLSHETGGLIAVNAFALLSSAALVSVAFRVVWLAVKENGSPVSIKPREYVFFNTQLGYYAICLLIGNLLTDISGLIGLQWLVDKGITEGRLCTMQAVLMQLGNWAIAYFTVAIAIHTFNSLVMRIRQSSIVSGIAITAGWILAVLVATGPFINPKQFIFSSGYGISGLSCGIRPIYPKAQFYYHLLPIFFASVVSAILYSVIFLVLRGTLNIKGGVSLTLDPNERWSSERVSENYHRFVHRIARSMLWYPFAYIALLIPYSVTRLLSISGYTVPFEATIFAYTCWFTLGVVNVALLYNTFHVVGTALDSSSQKESAWSYVNPKEYWRSEKYPTASFRSPTIASFGGRGSPQNSIGPLLSVHYERPMTVQSYHSYPGSPATMIGRDITPVNELTWQETPISPEITVQKFSPATVRSLGLHTRQPSNEPTGLTAAPRRIRSPVLHRPSIEHLSVVQGTWSPEHPPSPPSAHIFGRRDSITDSDYTSSPLSGSPISNAATLSAPSPRTLALKPLPGLPRHSRSFSAVPTIAPAPSGRQRPLFTSRHGSIGHAAEMTQQGAF